MNACTVYMIFYLRFLHPNPEDPKEAPGGFLTDINEVTIPSCYQYSCCYVYSKCFVLCWLLYFFHLLDFFPIHLVNIKSPCVNSSHYLQRMG